MIPRVARSGQSFRGAGLYYLNDKLSHQANNAFEGIGDYALHDKQDRSTENRVGFTAILNMEAQTPEEAIEQMTSSFERYREREANKRGRKLTKPVYTYSLSWAPDQAPDREEMLSAAHSSLAALRLEGLQTLIVQHTDEPQPHIHVIVNRIERDGSRARNIPFDQLRFSRWAEQYERDHGGIRCEQRVQNNERRRQGEFVKDEISLTRVEYEAREQRRQREPQPARRKDAFRHHNPQSSALRAKQNIERETLLSATKARIAQESLLLDKRFSPKWAQLYFTQAQRTAELAAANKVGIFERACFLYRHRSLLKTTGPLRMRDVVRLCLSGKALSKRLDRAHQKERKEYGDWTRAQKLKAADIAWTQHREEEVAMLMRHSLERDGLSYLQAAERENANTQPQATHEHGPSAGTPPTLSQGQHLGPDALDAFLRDQNPPADLRPPMKTSDKEDRRRFKRRDRGIDL